MRHALGRRIDDAWLVAFRTGLGLLLLFAAVRFVAKGWVQELYLAPTYHFAWFSWAVVPPAPVLYGLFALMALCGAVIAASSFLGPVGTRLYRPAVVTHLLAFGYVELLDITLYLNHYVLLTLVLAVMAVAPAPGRPVRAWVRWLLQLTFAFVWLWAGLCKLNADWLLEGQPLTGWLSAWSTLPLVGPWLALPLTGLLMSWGGAAYDLLIVPLLWWDRTRRAAIALAVVFHVTIWALFPIGIFPWLMILGTTLFAAPSWPRRTPRPVPDDGRPLAPLATATLALVVAGMALVPARPLWMSDDPTWTEEGFRFAWRVMLVEKTGMVDYTAVEHDTGRRWVLRPTDELTPWQHEQMRTQPDLIRHYALHLAERLRGDGHDVAIHADAFASLNGRPSQRLLRPDLDLTRPLSELRAAGWILPRQR